MCRQRAEHVPISCRKGTENLHSDKRFCKKVYKMILYHFAEVSKMCPKKLVEFRCCKTAARLAGRPPASPAALAGRRPPAPGRAEGEGRDTQTHAAGHGEDGRRCPRPQGGRRPPPARNPGSRRGGRRGTTPTEGAAAGARGLGGGTPHGHKNPAVYTSV